MDCHYKNGDVIEVTEDPTVLEHLKDPNCIIEEGVTIRFYVNESDSSEIITNKEVLQILDKKEVTKMEPQVMIQPVPQPIQQPVVVAQPVQEAAPVAPQAAPVVVATPEPVVTTATTTEAPAAPFDINAILTSTGGGGGIAIVLAILAVVGGGAGWKFYQKFAEQKHEQAMKKLEIEAQSQGLNGAQPPPCQAANAAIEAKLTAIEGKLATMEKKTSSFSAGFDAEDIEERVIKLEKKLKTISKGPTV